MPVEARIVFELLIVNRRVMRVVHCLCGDGVVLHAGEKATACHCGRSLTAASSAASS